MKIKQFIGKIRKPPFSQAHLLESSTFCQSLLLLFQKLILTGNWKTNYTVYREFHGASFKKKYSLIG
jgi:hypothetical protein